MDHITLSAVEEGLGTCWIGAFDEKKVKGILNIPDNIRVVALLPLGYPQLCLALPREKVWMKSLCGRNGASEAICFT